MSLAERVRVGAHEFKLHTKLKVYIVNVNFCKLNIININVYK